MTDTPEVEEDDGAETDDCLIECDTCVIGLAGGVDAFCSALDAIAVRFNAKDGRIEALSKSARTWFEVGRGSAKVSTIPKETKS